MPEAYSVFVEEGSPASSVIPALVSLPESIRTVHTGNADIIVVNGADHNWPIRVVSSYEHGARGVLVTDPVASPGSLDDVARVGQAIPVVIDRPWADNPGLRGLGREVLSSLGDLRFVTVTGIVEPGEGRDFHGAAIDAIVAVNRLVPKTDSFSLFSVSRTRSSLTVAGRSGQSPVRVTVTTSRAGKNTAELGWHADFGTITATVPDAITAAPAHITVTDPAGAVLRPTEYETSTRANLRRLVAALRSQELLDDVVEHREALSSFSVDALPR